MIFVPEGVYKHVFALVRPLKHHMRINDPTNLCIFNNIFLRAAYLLEKYVSFVLCVLKVTG